MCLNTIDIEDSIFNSHKYVDDYYNPDEWCKQCVCYGTMKHNPYWLCAKRWINITEVSYSGHCNQFSKDNKISKFKYWLLKISGFKFKNISNETLRKQNVR